MVETVNARPNTDNETAHLTWLQEQSEKHYHNEINYRPASELLEKMHHTIERVRQQNHAI